MEPSLNSLYISLGFSNESRVSVGRCRVQGPLPIGSRLLVFLLPLLLPLFSSLFVSSVPCTTSSLPQTGKCCNCSTAVRCPHSAGDTQGVAKGTLALFSCIVQLILVAEGAAGSSEGWITVRLDLRGVFRRKCDVGIARLTAGINQVRAQLLKPVRTSGDVGRRGVARKLRSLVLLHSNFSGSGLFLAVCLRSQKFSVLLRTR